MLEEGNAVEGAWRHREKMSYRGIMDMDILQKRTMFMGGRYTILERFAGPMRFPIKLLEKEGIPGNYNRMPLDGFMTWVRSLFPAEKALEVGANRMNWDVLFNSPIPDRDRREQGEEIVQYASTKRILLDYMQKLEYIKYARYRTLLDIWGE